MRKRWIAVPVAAGALAIGGVAFAANNGEPGELTLVDTAQSKVMQTAADWISADEAKDIAIEAAGGGDIRELEFDRGDRMYEIELLMDQGEADIDIDAITGEVLKLEWDDDGGQDDWDDDYDSHEEHNHHFNEGEAPVANLITQEEATNIALGKASENARVIEIELDDDDRYPVYEMELHDGMFEYDIDIDARTGNIVEFEKEEDD
ncbi:PepSY domain-containing protein [Bhargavaea cecembensis]|uniref:PepSY domain-containing protein n=1 Tax=Bhargavaea cecembensis TaxID=394098 RepID=UPI0006936608|nr:PepSY domain-containing protein [Bhargavaea cecembensis]